MTPRSAPMRIARFASPRRALRRLLTISLALLASVAGVAVAQTAPSAALRLVHLSPDAPRVDLQVGEGQRATVRDLPFGEASDYMTVPPGEYNLRVFPHRGRENGEGEADTSGLEPITLVADVEAGAYYTVALVGYFEPPPDTQRGSLSLDVTPDTAVAMIAGPRGFERQVTGDSLLEGLEAGGYTIEVNAPSYRGSQVEIQVEPLRTQVVSVTLQEGEEGGDADASGGGEDETMPGASSAQTTGGWNPAELQIFRDLQVGLPLPGTAAVRIVHASPLTAPIEVVWLLPVDEEGNGGGDASGDSGEGGDGSGVREEAAAESAGATGEIAARIDQALAYPNDSAYLQVPVAASVFEIRLGGGATVLRIDEFSPAAGSVATIFLVRAVDAEELQVVPVVEALVLTGRDP